LYGGDESVTQDEDPVELVDEEGKVFEAAEESTITENAKMPLTDQEKSIALKKAKKAGGAV